MKILFMPTPRPSGKDRELHVHSFVVFTAYHCTDNFVISRLGRGGQKELLRAGLEQQAPSFHFSSILGPQQGKAMNRSIPVPGLASAGRHPQEQTLTGLDGDFRISLPRDLVAAVAISQQFDD